MAHAKNHDYHVLPPSIWPLFAAVAAFVMLFGAVLWMHGSGPWMGLIGFAGVLYVMFAWWSEVVHESRAGDHTPVVRLGLRYGFNVLDLFAKGRFEGESVDYTLWGPERRPAKLGLVIVLFIVLSSTLGNLLVDARIAKDPTVQASIVARYQQEHAAELAQAEQDRQAFNKRVGLPAEPATAAGHSADQHGHGQGSAWEHAPYRNSLA